MLILEEYFRWHIEALASEFFKYVRYTSVIEHNTSVKRFDIWLFI